MIHDVSVRYRDGLLLSLRNSSLKIDCHGWYCKFVLFRSTLITVYRYTVWLMNCSSSYHIVISFHHCYTIFRTFSRCGCTLTNVGLLQTISTNSSTKLYYYMYSCAGLRCHFQRIQFWAASVASQEHRVLILDEASANVDTSTDEIV